jgi:hypothetical protein
MLRIIDSSGTIRTYNNKEYRFYKSKAKLLFDLFKLTYDERYLTALMHLQKPTSDSNHEQAVLAQRNISNQMWLSLDCTWANPFMRDIQLKI